MPRSALSRKCGRNLAKKHGEVNLSLHRQLLALYLDERLPITKLRVGPYLGYTNHTNVLYNIGKAKQALFKGKEGYILEYNKLKDFADKITPELDFYQRRDGKFVFTKDDYL